MRLITKKIFIISTVLLSLYLDDTLAADPGDVEKYLQAGTKLLAAGQLIDALAQYDNAIDGDPNNYLIYFRRATVFMGLGRTKSAIDDLSSALKLNPSFNTARTQRCNLYLKQGKLSEAKDDISYLLQQDPNDNKAKQLLSNIGEVAELIEVAKTHYENSQYDVAIEHLNKAIEITSMDLELRELRADCYMKIGDTKKAIIDLKHSVKLSNDDRAGILRLSKLMYESGDAEQSLIEIRECLKLDPDHKQCFEHYKFIKKLVKLQNSIQDALREERYKDCIEKADKLSKSEKNYQNFANQHLCACHMKGGDSNSAISICEIAHANEPNNLEVLCDLADSYIANEEFETASQHFQKVLEIDRDYKRAKEGVKKSQKLSKNSKKRNYYKILGVPRSSSKKEILRAYRKLAAEHHPDRYKGDNKKAGERKFIDITDSKDVLTDPEKRQKFDQGEDPLDPEHQHQGPSGNPFGGFTFHNFNPFENNDGGFQYEFHFG